MNNKKIKRNLISIIKNKSILAIFAIAVMVGGYTMFQSNLFIKEQDKELNEFISSTTSIPQNLGKLYNSSNCSGGTFINLNFGKNIAFFGANQPGTILSAYIDTGFTSKYEMYVQSTGKIVTGIKVGGCVDLSQYGLTANKELVVREIVNTGGTTGTSTGSVTGTSTEEVPYGVPALAYNSYGCVNQSGYTTTRLNLRNNLLPYPAGTPNGLSSFKIRDSFPDKSIAFFKRGSEVLYTVSKREVSLNSCINVPANINDKVNQIEIVPKCSIVAYGGINSTGTFPEAIRQVVQEFERGDTGRAVSLKTFRGFDSAEQAGTSANGDLTNARAAGSKKILGIFHSISSIGVFNKGIRSSGNTKIVLYDPPYNHSSANIPFADIFNRNAAAIRTARANGIASSTEIIDLTRGTAMPESAHSDVTRAKTIVRDWLNANCL